MSRAEVHIAAREAIRAKGYDPQQYRITRLEFDTSKRTYFWRVTLTDKRSKIPVTVTVLDSPGSRAVVTDRI
jgi:hypothetical protein